MPTVPYPPYEGELRSGNFGPNTGHYHAYVESYGVMARHVRDGKKCYHSRAEARQATPRRSGHVAVVGTKPTDACVAGNNQ